MIQPLNRWASTRSDRCRDGDASCTVRDGPQGWAESSPPSEQSASTPDPRKVQFAGCLDQALMVGLADEFGPTFSYH